MKLSEWGGGSWKEEELGSLGKGGGYTGDESDNVIVYMGNQQ